MSRPLFSVIIPAYNASKFIRSTLDSVRLQSFNDYEIIIVNDGSKDDTLGVVKAYFTDFPNLNYKIINQENRGIGGARNSGIKIADGAFIAFLDADDRWFKEKLEKVKVCIERNPELDLIYHNEYLVENGTVKKKLIYCHFKSYQDLLFKRNCISTSSAVVKKSKIFEAGLFSENLEFNGVEDYELWLRLSQICKIYYLREFLGEYNVHGSGITSNIEKHNRNTLNVVEFHFRNWPRKSLYYKFLLCKRKADIARIGGRKYLKRGGFNSARLYLVRSLMLNPFSIKTWIIFGACIIKVRL